MQFRDGQKITIISISEMFQTTVVREVKLTRTVEGRQAYIVKGKRKEYFLDITRHLMVFDGWSNPITGVHGGAFNGYVFITDNHEQLREFIIDRNMNELFDRHEMIMYRKPFAGNKDLKFLFEK